MTDEKILRINELSKKSKTVGLTEEEKVEQKRLREEYVAGFRASLQRELDNTYIKRPDGKIEKIFMLDNKIITVTNVFPKDRSSSFHVTSIFEISENMIASVDEYWADDGEAPKWRRDMNIGRSIK